MAAQPPQPPAAPPQDVLWLVLKITAAHGHTREAAKATLASSELRRDATLLSYILNVKTRYGTLLAHTVRRGDMNRVLELLAVAASAHTAPAARQALLNPEHGPLLSLCQDAAMLQSLLGAGARLRVVDGQSDELESALSSYRGAPAVVAALLASLGAGDREALITRRDQNGQSLLSRARDGATARVLLDAGATGLAADGGPDDFDRVTSEDRDGSPGVLAAMLAALGDEERRARVARTPDEHGRTLLMGAVSGVDAQALLDAGAELDAVDDFGADAFNFSLYHPLNEHPLEAAEASVLSTLLCALGSARARRKRVTHLDDDGRTLLMHVSSDADARTLLDAGARAHVWDVDNDGNDALWHAVHRDDHLDCNLLPVLLEAMAAERSDEAVRKRVNRLDGEERTLLMYAYTAEDVRALLIAGADVRARDRKGHDAIWYVNELPSRHNFVEYQFKKLEVLLTALTAIERRQMVRDCSLFFVSLALYSRDELVDLQFLVRQGLDVTACWEDGRYLFSYIATELGRRAQPLLEMLLGQLGDTERQAVMQRPDIMAALAHGAS